MLLPSLGLLSQSLKEWVFAKNDDFEVLCVCSDKTVGKNYDAPINQVSDIGLPPTTIISEIKQFLEQPKKQVVFSTYQSSPQIVEAQKK